MSRKRELKIIPKGWPCLLGECPAGLFVYSENGYDGILCVKTAHGPILANGNEAWCRTSEKNALMVQPCEAVWSGVGYDIED